MSQPVFANSAGSTRPRRSRLQDPVLGDIPLIGPVLFNQNLFVYGALILVTLSTYYLFHPFQAAARAVGKHPRFADTLGIDVIKTRYAHGLPPHGGRIWRGMVTLGSVGRFDENMTFGQLSVWRR